MRTNIVLAGLSIMFIAVATAFNVNYLDYRSPISYSNATGITLSDFKGLAKPGLTLDGEAEFAYIATDRNISYPTDTSVQIITFFYPSRSYVFNREMRNAELLNHELYHFHIAEYFTRMIKAEIMGAAGKISPSEIEQIATKYTDMERIMQVEYDNETYHSYVLKAQKEWELKIDKWLSALNNFSSATVSLQR